MLASTPETINRKTQELVMVSFISSWLACVKASIRLRYPYTPFLPEFGQKLERITSPEDNIFPVNRKDQLTKALKAGR
jgi:hypothetical protein